MVGNTVVYIYQLEHVVEVLQRQGMYRTSARKWEYGEYGRELGVVRHMVFFISLVWLVMCIL